MDESTERAALAPAEVAQLLGIGERQAREFINSGRIFSFRIGRRILVPRRALEALLNGTAAEQAGGQPTKKGAGA